MPKGPAAGELRPLTPGEWNELAQVLIGKKLRPGALLQLDPATVQTQLGLSQAAAARLTQLLSRGAQLAVEVERLGSLGIWVLTRADEAYPAPLKEQLGASAPPVLFGAGDQALLHKGFVAVVGSRDIDEASERFAAEAGAACATSGLVLVSGGAKGVDQVSMRGCLAAGGTVIGVLADSLERVIREPDFRTAILAGKLVMVSAVHPKAPFSVANAMARNKYIYCLARYGLAVASSLDKGGTRAGALEVLKHRWVPLYVRSGDTVPPGNVDLIKRGAIPFPNQVPADGLDQWLAEHAVSWAAAPSTTRRSLTASKTTAEQDDLFPLVWPHIAERLQKWASPEELARHLCVDVGQLRQWIDRARQTGLLQEKRQVAGGGGGADGQMRLDL
jgi:predicted Rossmann fold nucleotide-binding protein DprA/Smf involved in DNA uptake